MERCVLEEVSFWVTHLQNRALKVVFPFYRGLKQKARCRFIGYAEHCYFQPRSSMGK